MLIMPAMNSTIKTILRLWRRPSDRLVRCYRCHRRSQNSTRWQVKACMTFCHKQAVSPQLQQDKTKCPPPTAISVLFADRRYRSPCQNRESVTSYLFMFWPSCNHSMGTTSSMGFLLVFHMNHSFKRTLRNCRETERKTDRYRFCGGSSKFIRLFNFSVMWNV